MMEIAVVILAAGGSRRLGRPKQLLKVGGASLLRRTAQTALASHADHCVIVLGNQHLQCAAEVSNLPVSLEVNEAWSDGMSSSIRVGMLAAQRRHPDLEAVILVPCDQPFLTSALLDELIDQHLATACGIVASAYQNQAGIPVLFSSAYFTELTSLRGDQGAKSLFNERTSDVALVPFEGGEVDIDTLEDMTGLQEMVA